jgi:hypothetical protein
LGQKEPLGGTARFTGYLALGDQDIPATSKAPQKAAGSALVAKSGDQSKSKLRGRFEAN